MVNASTAGVLTDDDYAGDPASVGCDTPFTALPPRRHVVVSSSLPRSRCHTQRQTRSPAALRDPSPTSPNTSVADGDDAPAICRFLSCVGPQATSLIDDTDDANSELASSSLSSSGRASANDVDRTPVRVTTVVRRTRLTREEALERVATARRLLEARRTGQPLLHGGAVRDNSAQ